MNAVQSLTKNLAAYLRAQVPALAAAEIEWPAANHALAYPSVTIFSGTPQFTNAQPYEISRTLPDLNNQVVSTMVIGEYDVTLQLDLWCRSKLERENIFGLVFAAINKQLTPMGLSLQLTDYFNEWARYDISGHQFVDDEQGAEREEWRVRIDLLANVRALATQTNYGMISFDNEVTTPNNIPG